MNAADPVAEARRLALEDAARIADAIEDSMAEAIAERIRALIPPAKVMP